MKSIRLSSRSSPLALAQNAVVIQLLKDQYPNLNVEELPRTTVGDREQTRTLQAIGGKGVFVREIEQQLLDGEADIAVHSMKDLPIDPPRGISTFSVGPRADACDALVSSVPFENLPDDAKIGTASLRRTALLANIYRRTNVSVVRGNVQTRIRRLDEGRFDALILAKAGLDRMNLGSRITSILPITPFVPAPAQGVLAVQCRADDAATRKMLLSTQRNEVEMASSIERRIVKRLGGDCSMPIGVYCEVNHDSFNVHSVVLSADGSHCLRVHKTSADPAQVSEEVGDTLIRLGALDLVAEA